MPLLILPSAHTNLSAWPRLSVQPLCQTPPQTSLFQAKLNRQKVFLASFLMTSPISHKYLLMTICGYLCLNEVLWAWDIRTNSLSRLRFVEVLPFFFSAKGHFFHVCRIGEPDIVSATWYHIMNIVTDPLGCTYSSVFINCLIIKIRKWWLIITDTIIAYIFIFSNDYDKSLFRLSLSIMINISQWKCSLHKQPRVKEEGENAVTSQSQSAILYLYQHILDVFDAGPDETVLNIKTMTVARMYCHYL